MTVDDDPGEAVRLQYDAEIMQAFRLDLAHWARTGVAVERWPILVAFAADGWIMQPASPLAPLFREIVAVELLLVFVGRCRRVQRDNVKEQSFPELLDKSGWPYGQDEPDRVEWTYKGVPCVINRSLLGAWCGYVAVTLGHPWYDAECEQIRRAARVHREITYAGDDSFDHLLQPQRHDDPPLFWVGFHCGYAWDCPPKLEADLRTFGSTLEEPDRCAYRDKSFMMDQVDKLAEQSIAAARGDLS